jgi:putative transcriptional regulator
MRRIELLDEVRDILIKAGFYVSDLYTLRPVGFDLVARRDNSLLIIKVLTNIDALSEEVARELRTLSVLLKGCPLLIGDRSATSILEEDVVYDRFSVQAINFKTLKNHILDGMPLEVYAAPGGLYVNLDSEKIKKLRMEESISLGSFARAIKVSRRTVQMYEEGMNASVEIAIRIEDFLDSNVTIPIDLVKNNIKENELNSPSYETQQYRSFQKEIFSILKQLGYKVIPLERAPFEAISQNKKKVLLTCIDEYNQKLLRKARIVNSISKITEKHAVLITNKDINKTSIGGTPLIVKKELKKTRGPEELLNLILERLYNSKE